MSILKKIFTALKGGVTEVGEAVVDSQSIRILEQEMRDARAHLDEAKENLAKVMAEQLGVGRKVKQLKDTITEHEGYATQALNKGNEQLATEIAERIAEHTNELEAQQKVYDSYNATITGLRETIRTTERNIQSMEREVSVVKTTESVNKASEAAAAKFSGSNSALRSATDSLERIKNRQQQQADQMKAAMELQREENGTDLKDKLKAAGIVTGSATANSILDKLKAKQPPSGGAGVTR